MSRKFSLLALTIFALALVGCGDSEKSTQSDKDSAAPAPTALTKTELVAQADAICKDMQKELDAVPSPESMEDLEKAIAKQIEIAGPAIEELQAVTPPEELATKYEAWTSKLATMQERTVEIRKAAAAGSQEEVQKIVTDTSSINTEADKLGKQIGFKTCAR
mgnify:FL=1